MEESDHFGSTLAATLALQAPESFDIVCEGRNDESGDESWQNSQSNVEWRGDLRIVHNLISDTIHFPQGKTDVVYAIVNEHIKFEKEDAKNGGKIFKSARGSVTVTVYNTTWNIHVQGSRLTYPTLTDDFCRLYMDRQEETEVKSLSLDGDMDRQEETEVKSLSLDGDMDRQEETEVKSLSLDGDMDRQEETEVKRLSLDGDMDRQEEPEVKRLSLDGDMDRQEEPEVKRLSLDGDMDRQEETEVKSLSLDGDMDRQEETEVKILSLSHPQMSSTPKVTTVHRDRSDNNSETTSLENLVEMVTALTTEVQTLRDKLSSITKQENGETPNIARNEAHREFREFGTQTETIVEEVQPTKSETKNKDATLPKSKGNESSSVIRKTPSRTDTKVTKSNSNQANLNKSPQNRPPQNDQRDTNAKITTLIIGSSIVKHIDVRIGQRTETLRICPQNVGCRSIYDT